MKIIRICADKESYMPLLLLGDEQEDMIDKYLQRSELYVCEDAAGEAAAVIAVTDEGDSTLEIKNLAVREKDRGKGLGRRMIEHVASVYRGRYRVLLVGTGDSPLTIPFYEKCGFMRSHIIPDFFKEYYDHPIIEAGVELRDMVYLKRQLSCLID